jgi:hypothetical protein
LAPANAMQLRMLRLLYTIFAEISQNPKKISFINEIELLYLSKIANLGLTQKVV